MAGDNATQDTAGQALEPEHGEVIVRMYRHGLGDCYLLAFGADADGDQDRDGVRFVLIDCGVHRRQPDGKNRLAQVLEDIEAVTGGYLHVVVVTHEHADHISGFAQSNSPFISEKMSIGQLWVAWTEEPGNPQADALRKKKLVCTERIRKALKRLESEAAELKAAATPARTDGADSSPAAPSSRQAAADDSRPRDWRTLRSDYLRYRMQAIDDYLQFDDMDFDASAAGALSRAVQGSRLYQTRETACGLLPDDAKDGVQTNAASADQPVRIPQNQKAMVLVAMRSDEQRYCVPGETLQVPGVEQVQVHVLGPPKNEKWLKKENPSKVRGEHRYKEVYLSDRLSMFTASPALSMPVEGESQAQAQAQTANATMFMSWKDSPFGDRSYCVPEAEIGSKARGIQEEYDEKRHAYRKLSVEWLGDAEALALAMDNDTNNTSLVLAFELGKHGKGDVLLFCGDAQVGNWLSWRDQGYGEKKLSADDLLERTVLYKVGHHGSHNATLKADSRRTENHPEGEPYGLELMNDIIAMINVEQSAVSRRMPIVWRMPHEPLYQVLSDKAKSRVLRADNKPVATLKDFESEVRPHSSEWEKVPGKKHCQWRLSDKHFTSEPAIELYVDISFRS